MSVSLSQSAARRINKITADQASAKGVRLEIIGGGCSGYQYKFGFADSIDLIEDEVIICDGASLVIDKMSFAMLEGSEIDYGESLMESGFRVVNPNAVSSCGCGTSFAVKEEVK